MLELEVEASTTKNFITAKAKAIFGTGLTMDRKIPTALWKTQLLKLVSEAPKAVCVESDVQQWDVQQLLSSPSPHNNGHNTMRITPTSYKSSSSTSSTTDINGIHQPNCQSHSHHHQDETTSPHSHNTLTHTHPHTHVFVPNHSNSNSTNGINGLSTLTIEDANTSNPPHPTRGQDDEDDDKLENNGFSTETLKTTSSSSMSSSASASGGSGGEGGSIANIMSGSNAGLSTTNTIWDPLLMDISNPFGKAFHGYLTHSKTQELLVKDGQYLVGKRVDDDDFILSLRFNGHIKNFQISYEDSTGLLFVGERDKPYRTLQELVQEGLITLYLDQKEGPYIDLMCDLSKFHLGLKSSQTNGTSNNSISSASHSNGNGNSNGHSKMHTTNGHSKNGTGSSLLRKNKSFSNGSSSPSPTVSTTISNGSTERHTRRTQELRTHLFQIHTFEGLPTCHICQNFMWGLSSQGLQCTDCETSIHESCLKEVQNNCKPKLELYASIFGTSLNVIVKSADGIQPPFVIAKCIAQIDKKGLSTEGIYRVSGSKDLIERLKTRMELERESVDLSNYNDIHSMCGLVKLYLRNLPVSLITTEVFDQFLANNGPVSLEMIKMNLRKLPLSHQITLKFLLQHLYKVAEKSDVNKMNAFNIASVFTPTIICRYEISLSTLKIGTSILETMITYVPILYPERNRTNQLLL